MSVIKKARKIYKLVSLILLLICVIITAFFIVKGLKIKNLNKPDQQFNNEKSDNNPADNSQNLIDQMQYNLIIDNLGISAPVIMNIDGNNSDEYNNALENGVAHLKGSALFGKSGNVFIFGHSSHQMESSGNYKEIFAKLGEIKNGDIIEIQGQEARYIYSVKNKVVVEPNDVSVASQNLNLKQLTLMTCWPIGTTEKRLVVISELLENN